MCVYVSICMCIGKLNVCFVNTKSEIYLCDYIFPLLFFQLTDKRQGRKTVVVHSLRIRGGSL